MLLTLIKGAVSRELKVLWVWKKLMVFKLSPGSSHYIRRSKYAYYSLLKLGVIRDSSIIRHYICISIFVESRLSTDLIKQCSGRSYILFLARQIDSSAQNLRGIFAELILILSIGVADPT